jgi:hypothetical protein
MVTSVAQSLADKWNNYLSFYFLAQWSEPIPEKKPRKPNRKKLLLASRRYMIYPHSKLMICDDLSMMLGSCNLNERGLAGDRDSEICVSHWPAPGKERDCQNVLKDLRRRLWTEHLAKGLKNDALDGVGWVNPESPDCVKQVRQLARVNYFNFRRNTRRKQSGHLCAWPIMYDRDGPREIQLGVPAPGGGDYRIPIWPAEFDHELIPDHEVDLAAKKTGDLLGLLEDSRASNWAVRPIGTTVPGEFAE